MADKETETKKPRLEKFIPEEEDVEEEVVETYHNPNKLIRIATWSNTISWITLVVAVALGIVKLYLNINQVQQYAEVPPVAYMYYVGDGVVSIVIGVFYFLVLQAVSEGINILLDIHENTAGEED